MFDLKRYNSYETVSMTLNAYSKTVTIYKRRIAVNRGQYKQDALMMLKPGQISIHEYGFDIKNLQDERKKKQNVKQVENGNKLTI